ncbi:DNA primase, partial [Leptospira santarosai]|nr:DNA primase [Leptospira santarosai]
LSEREKERNVKTEVELSPEERAQAVQYLEDPKLLTNIVMDFERCGLVGERVNSLVGYLASITRRTENPLAIIIQSSSSAGKSTLMDSILDFVPEEEKEKYSAMTGQSLFYMSSKNLKNKVLAVSEEEGAERAKYALKILQSEKKISIASAMKDPTTGRTVTEEYSVEGPVVIFLTTTNLEIDEELENRCIILTVNEGREQTRTILEIQRELETLEGIVKKRDKEKILGLHKNVQRILRPFVVVNPYAKELKFPDTKLRMRRDQKKYLTLIKSIALLHQYQREKRMGRDENGESFEYIEVTKEDMELGSILASKILGRTLEELTPQTKEVLYSLHTMVEKESEAQKISKSEVRFT